MIRTCMLAAAAAIALGMSALAPGRAADLGGWYGGYRGGGSCLRFYNGLPVSFGYGLCYQRELLQTPWGPRWRLVNHCC
jgi:hypothetical protein